jgi:hypothetical protein
MNVLLKNHVFDSRQNRLDGNRLPISDVKKMESATIFFKTEEQKHQCINLLLIMKPNTGKY